MGKLSVLNGGRLDAAIERVRGWRRHFTADESRELAEVSEALVARGEQERPYTRDELRLMDLGERLSLLTRSRPKAPRPPSPFDERIAETEAALAPATEALDAAHDELFAAKDAHKQATRKFSAAAAAKDARGARAAEAAVHAALDRIVHAESDLHVRDHAWLRLRGRLTSLQLLRDRWHAEQTSMVRGRDGSVVSLAEFTG